MEPITDLLCFVGALPFQWLLLVPIGIIWGVISGYFGEVVFGMIWTVPLTIIFGILRIAHLCIGILFAPLIVIFPNPFLWVGEVAAVGFDANIAGLITGIAPVFWIIAIILGIIDFITYFILTLACNSTGIHLGSTLIQTILSYITA
jgi:hypothetical protein